MKYKFSQLDVLYLLTQMCIHTFNNKPDSKFVVRSSVVHGDCDSCFFAVYCVPAFLCKVTQLWCVFTVTCLHK